MTVSLLTMLISVLVPTLTGAFLLSRRQERLAGQLDAHERECVEYRKRLDERHATTQLSLVEVNAKLDRLLERG